jgi:hypothetical protein
MALTEVHIVPRLSCPEGLSHGRQTRLHCACSQPKQGIVGQYFALFLVDSSLYLTSIASTSGDVNTAYVAMLLGFLRPDSPILLLPWSRIH